MSTDCRRLNPPERTFEGLTGFDREPAGSTSACDFASGRFGLDEDGRSVLESKFDKTAHPGPPELVPRFRVL
jgi:hypothetical protein